MSQGAKVRARAAKVVAAVLTGKSLDEPLAQHAAGLSDKDQAFLKALAYGCIRRLPRHQAVIRHLLRNPNKPINPMMQALLAVGLEQIVATRVPEHAAVAATVAASRMVNQSKGSGFLNAILRRYLREREETEETLSKDETFQYQHPKWLLEKFKSDWPDNWQDIVATNNSAPPMWLRINRLKVTRDTYLSLLSDSGIKAEKSPLNDTAIILGEPVSVAKLPHFGDGWVSVQDLGAQYAATLVAAKPGERILDACAAPGGKAMHILETCPECDLTALDLSDERLQKVKENADRLGFAPHLQQANAALIKDWWDGEPFDAVLVDTPCTGSGVIRRNPDIKILRRPKDVMRFNQLQQPLVRELWKTVAPGGRLIYATCSVFPEENEAFVASMLKSLTDAQTALPDHAGTWGKLLNYGVQMLPEATGSDGFYYAVLIRTPE